jgi:hypothetical protein
MKETIFYVKKGRRYVPHSSYSPEFCDSFPKGNHLVSVYPGGSSRRFNIDPTYAPMIAAGRVAEDAISKKIMETSALRVPERDKPLTDEQRNAWEALSKAMGKEVYALEWCSYREAAEAGVEAMMKETKELLSNPAVKKAYDNFVLMCELVKENKQ